jgi:hypothetical protein
MPSLLDAASMLSERPPLATYCRELRSGTLATCLNLAIASLINVNRSRRASVVVGLGRRDFVRQQARREFFLYNHVIEGSVLRQITAGSC